MVKQLPKYLLEDFDKKNKNFKEFKNKEKKVPNMGKINYDSNEILFYYYDFELISAEIFEYLFNFINLQNNNDILKISQKLNLDKPEKVECLIDKKYILIKFLKPTAENKFLLEIGNLNSEKIFEPEFFLLYDKLSYLYGHINNIIENGGFNLYCELFKTFQKNTIDIFGDNNIKSGIVIKKNMNKYNLNNYPFEKDPTNDQLQIFKKMNSSETVQNQNDNNQQNSFILNQRNNQFFNINEKIILKNIFLKPPRVGLNNIGAPPYMNSILQCLCQIEEIVIYFKYDNHVNEIKDDFNEKYLTPSFKILIEEIWPKDAEDIESRNRHYSPHEFKNKISLMNLLFVNNQVNDSKNFIDFIIRTLHEELNTSIISYDISGMNTYLNNNNNQFDYAFQVFNEVYQKILRSKISELFYAISHKTTQCLSCKNCKYNFQAYNLLEFHLEEVKNYAITLINNNMIMNNSNNLNNNNSFMLLNNNDNNQDINSIKLSKLNNNIVGISDCFEFIQKVDTVQDSYKIFCSNCGFLANMAYSYNLTTAPKILIILLNRGIYNQFNIKLEFSTELDITKYVSKKTGNTKYQLIGVITHVGESGEGGYFIAHCLSPVDNRWYTYNDSNVKETDNFKKNVIDFGMPYFLFYKKFE